MPGLEQLLGEFSGQLCLQVVQSADTGYRSTALWDGLKRLNGEYFAILDDDDEFFPNHLSSLIKILERHPNVNMAYSGAVRVWEPERGSVQNPGRPRCEIAELAYFDTMDMSRLLHNENFITSNSWVARTSAIETWMLADPNLTYFEDFFLLLCLLTTSTFIFSYEATCCFYLRDSKQDNSLFLDRNEWLKAQKRIHFLLRGCSFPLHLSTAAPVPISETLKVMKGLESKPREISRRIRKYIKYILPYGLVRFYQSHSKS